MNKTEREMSVDEEVQTQLEIYNYMFGFAGIAAAKCAVDLKIADVLEAHGSPMTLMELSAALGCEPPLIHRIMRLLTHRKIFEEKTTTQGAKSYAQTLLSRLLTTTGDKGMGAFILMANTPEMLMPFLGLSRFVTVANKKLSSQQLTDENNLCNTQVAAKATNKKPTPYEEENGKDVWGYAESHGIYNKLFNEAMACHARMVVPKVIQSCAELFEGIRSIVDVGGGVGMAMQIVVEAFPHVRGINFDLPHVIAEAPKSEGVEHVAGNMFESVPKVDAVFLMCVLHDWGDEECIHILKRCKKAIPKDKGKVIIVDTVVDHEEQKEDKLRDVKLMLDMIMMVQTSSGKERSFAEWKYVIEEAGFRNFTVNNIRALQSVIVALP